MAPLETIVSDEPRDIDGYVHLGTLHWDMSSPRSRRIAFTTPPTQRQHAAWLDTALEHYLAGVAVGELSLPDLSPGCCTGPC